MFPTLIEAFAVKIRLKPYDLHLRHTFTIARGSQDIVRTLLLEISQDGIAGYGEASPSSFYGQTVESVQSAIEALIPWLEGENPEEYRSLLAEARKRLGGNAAALCALDLALHDWACKKLGVPLYRLLGLNPRGIPATSYTIGIDTIPKMIAKLEEFPGWPIYKIKLGAGEDIAIVSALRERTDAIFRVDANCGWREEDVAENSRALRPLGVEFIEQPMPPQAIEAMEDLYVESELPLMADEDATVPSDVPGLAGRFHAINIKLVKCGGIQPALEMIALARAYGMKVMLGCMIESSNCCGAAAHLGPLVDYLDLDGPVLIENDPFSGLSVTQGRISLSDAPGFGLELNDRFE